MIFLSKGQSQVKDYACLPVSPHLFDGNLMVSYSFDLCINGMTVGVESFASHCGSQVRWLQQRKGKGAAEEALRIVEIQQLAEPTHQQVLQVGSTDTERDGVLRTDCRRITHQVEHGPGSVSKELWQVAAI